MAMSLRDLLRAMFDAAVEAALPGKIVLRHPPPPPRGRTIVLGAGKASAAMARAVEVRWPGPLEGLVVTHCGHGPDRDRRGSIHKAAEVVACALIELPSPGRPRSEMAGME